MRLLLRLLRATNSRRLAWVIGLGLLLAVTEGISLLLLVPVLNGLQGNGVDVSGWPVLGSFATVVPLAVILLLLVLVVMVRGGVTVIRDRVTTELRLEVLDRQRLAALDAALNARWSWLLSRRGSDIVQVVNTEVARVGFMVDLFARLTIGVFMAIAITVAATIVAPVVGAIGAVLAVITGVALLPTARSAHRLGQDQVDANRDYAATVTDAVGSLKLVRAHEAASRWLLLLHRAMQRMAGVQVSFATRSSLQRAAVSVLSAVGASVLVLVSLAVGVGADQLIVLVVLVARLLSTVQSLGQTGQMAANFLPAVATVQELLDEAVVNADPTSGSGPIRGRLPVGRLEIDVRDVRFGYDEVPVLEGVSLTCARGQVTAITGPSGVGKSTLVDLILGLLSPQGGSIRVNGMAMSPDVVREMRGRLGYVPQDVHVLPGTLRENLTWSVDGVPEDAEIWAALDRACAEFARDLPRGLETELGERGVRLSGGQRQRIALARALLRQPDLLVLDEATSALDPATEARVLAAIRDLGTTVVLVAHRESTLTHADATLRLVGS